MLTITPGNPWGEFVLPVLSTSLGSEGLEVLDPRVAMSSPGNTAGAQ